MFFPGAENRHAVCVFLEQKICSGSFICSRIFFQPIFPAIRETDLCSGRKRNLFWVYFYRKVSYSDQIQRTAFG